MCRYCEATPVKLSSGEADKLAKELEGNKGGGLSSWNKVRSAEGSSHDLFYFFNPKSFFLASSGAAASTPRWRASVLTLDWRLGRGRSAGTRTGPRRA